MIKVVDEMPSRGRFTAAWTYEGDLYSHLLERTLLGLIRIFDNGWEFCAITPEQYQSVGAKYIVGDDK